MSSVSRIGISTFSYIVLGISWQQIQQRQRQRLQRQGVIQQREQNQLSMLATTSS